MMTRVIQKRGKTIRISVHAHKFHNKVVRAVRELKRADDADGSPSNEAVAEWMYYYGTPSEDDGSRQKLVEKIHATRTSPAFTDTTSLETPIDDGEHTQLRELIPEEIVPSAIEALLEGEHREAIGSAINRLRPKEKHVIHYRFFADWTLDQIAKTMLKRNTERHLTRERVRQIEVIALKKLRLLLKKYHAKRMDESR